MNEADLRDRLAGAASKLRVNTPPLERIAQRGRRRSVRRVLAGTLVGTVLAPTIVWAGLTLSRTETNPAGRGVTHIDVGGRPIRPMVVGEGALWAIVQKDGGGDLALVRIDEETTETTDVSSAGRSQWVAVGAGSVWAISATCPESSQDQCLAQQLLRIDPDNLEIETAVPLSDGLAVGLVYGEGSIWTAILGRFNSTVLRIDPDTGEVTRFENCCGTDLAVSHGGVWTLNDGRVSRFDLASGKSEWVKLTAPGRPRFFGGGHILAASGDSVWVVAGGGGTAPIVRIDARTAEVADVIEEVGFGWPGVVENELWMARCDVDCIELVRVDSNGIRSDPVMVEPGRDANFIRHGLSLGPTYTVAASESEIWIGNEEGFEVIRVSRDLLDTLPPPRPAVEHFQMGGRPVRPIAVGYGAAWFIVQDGGAGNLSLARIDNSTGYVERVAAAGEPEYIAVGSGSIWTATCSGRTISGCPEPQLLRIDPQTLEAVATLELPGSPMDLAFGGGSVWVAVHSEKPSILRIDPATNQMVATIADQFCCHDIAYGEGALWGIAQGRPHDGELARIDSAMNTITYPAESLRDQFRNGGSVVAAGEGAVWVEASGTLARIDPLTGRITDVLENAATSLFVAAEGAVWVTRLTEDEACVQLLHVDPDQVEPEVVRAIPLVGEWHPMDFITLGPSMATGAGEGAVWITIDATWEVIRVDLARLDEGPVTDPACTASPSN